ncbi:MAG: thioredoxin domain-containing protein [Gammaproteobacteria bacterium]|nr:thioredoxin domain-containing protein [Gammaproteobacteria bacterium]
MSLRNLLITICILIAPLSTVVADSITQQQANDILSELKEIKLLLRQLANSDKTLAPSKPIKKLEQAASIPIGDHPYLGKEDAPLILVEYTDYECPYCNRFNATVLPELKKKYVEKGLLKVVVKDFPLKFHNNAVLAATAARCAREQGFYWEMREELFKNAKNLKKETLIKLGARHGPDSKQYLHCLEDTHHDAAIKRDIREGRLIGITGTPSFVLGRPDSKGMVKGIRFTGARSLAYFESQLKAVLKENDIAMTKP